MGTEFLNAHSQPPALGSAIAALEEAIFAPDLLANALERVGADLNFDHFCLVHSDLHAPCFIASDRTAAALQTYIKGGWLAADYRAPRIDQISTDGIFLDQMAVSNEERQQSAIYHELYVPAAMAHFAAWRFEACRSTWLFSLARAEDKGPLSEVETQTLLALAPVANRALLLARKTQDIHAQGMIDGLAAAGVAAIILDFDGLCTSITPAAARAIDENFDIVAGRLWARDPVSQRELGRLTATARSKEMPGALASVVVRRADGRCPIVLTPTTIRGPGLDAFRGGRILIMLNDLEASTDSADGLLRTMFDLTVSEAQIAISVAQGRDLIEIAEQRRVAVSTVRSQLKAIYNKLDISRQGELVRLVERLARY